VCSVHRLCPWLWIEKGLSIAQMNEIQVCMYLCLHMVCEWVVPCRHNLEAFTVSRSVGVILITFLAFAVLHHLYQLTST